MTPAAIAYFSATLFLAFTTLIKWKRRRGLIAARLNRGLRGYVEAKGSAAEGIFDDSGFPHCLFADAFPRARCPQPVDPAAPPHPLRAPRRRPTAASLRPVALPRAPRRRPTAASLRPVAQIGRASCRERV